MGRFYALFILLVVSLRVNAGAPLTQQEVVQSPEKSSLEDTLPTEQANKEVEDSLKKGMPINPEEPKAFNLMPHKATYTIELHPHKKPKDITIKDVTGKSVIEVVQAKEGWTYKQNLEVQVHYHDGTTTTIERNVASWESPTEVDFRIENFRDGASESLLQGNAEITEEGGWRVYFQKPEMDGFIADQLIIFPLGYLRKILETIEQNKRILSDQIVFDATYEIQAPMRVNTVITPLKEIPQKEITLLPSTKLWRLQEALYDIQSTDSVADYEDISLDIFSTGVIYAMETTWGEGITVILKLKELTIYK